MKIFRKAEDWWWGTPIAILHKFHRPPYGGGNQFLLALKSEWEKNGMRVSTHVGRRTRTLLFNSFNFDFALARKANRSRIRMVHRVDGPVSAYRGKECQEDFDVWKINHDCADITIFQSRYSYEKHLEMGLKFKSPVIIPNAANPKIFYPRRNRPSLTSEKRKIRVIATSWSDNPKKGAKTYQWLDRHLDRDRFDFTFAGRIGVDLPNSKLLPPVPSEQVAELLRQHDVYITASENDACSNALIEALSCGLPTLFLKSGGNPELVGEGGLGFDQAEELPELLNKLADQYENYVSLIRAPKLNEIADRYLEAMKPQ